MNQVDNNKENIGKANRHMKKKRFIFWCVLIIVTILGILIVNKEKVFGKNKRIEYKCKDGNEIVYKPLSEDNIAEENGCRFINNEILVYISSADEEKKLIKYLEKVEGRIVGKIPQINQYQIELKTDKSLKELEKIIRKMQHIKWVEHVNLNYILETTEQFYPNDKEWKNNWSDNAGGTNWGMEAIKVPEAWEYIDKMNPVNVGVFDNVFDTKHEDLREVFVEEPLGNFSSKNNTTLSQEHGTHVSGIIGANFNNNTGVCGVCPTARLYGVAYTSKHMKNYSTTQFINVGFTYLISNDCRVINASSNSLGDEYSFCASRNNEYAKNTIKDVAREVGYYLECMIKEGYKFIICNCSGNINEDNGRYKFYRKESFNDKTELSYYSEDDYERYKKGKADQTVKRYFKKYGETRAESGNVEAKYEVLCAIENKNVQDVIITVGAIEPDEKDENGNIKTYKETAYSQGGEAVDVVAPGGSTSSDENKIYSTVPGGYGYNSGTSMAAPHVSGVAALIFALDPNIKPSRVKEIIVETSSGEYGKGKYGLVDAEAAVRRTLKIVNRDNLVTDAFTWSYDDAYGNTSTYSIPKINVYGREIAKLNKEIYEYLYEKVTNAQKSVEGYGVLDGCTNIKYNWHIYDDILCLDISYSMASIGESHMYYHIDINNGTILTNEMILDKKEITHDEFVEMAEKVVAKNIFDHTMDVNNGLRCYKDILEQADIANAPIFIDKNGDLYFLVTIWYPEKGTAFTVTLKCEDIDFTLPTTNNSGNNNTSDDLTYICSLVRDHYNTVLDTDEFRIFEEECHKTNTGYNIILRTIGGNSANQLVDMVEVNTTTGEVRTESLDVDTWYYK